MPERAAALEAEVTGRALSDVEPGELGRRAMEALDSIPADAHGSAAYRTRVGAVMVARAWSAAATEARGG